MTALRVGINLTQFVPGKSGGVQSYAESLVRELLREGSFRYVLFVNHDTRSLFEGHASEGCEIAMVDFPIPRLYSAAGRLTKRIPFWAYCRGLRTFMESRRVDLMHFPMNLVIPIDYRGRCVSTFHDIQQEYHPEFFSAVELRWRAQHYRPSARKATHVVTISDYTKASLVEKYGLSPEKITTVHTGVEDDFFTDVDGGPRPADLPERFFFYPAAFWPHKNHLRLLQAVARLRERDGFRLPLLLSGMNAADDGPARAEVERLGLTEQVSFLGYISRERLRQLFRHADFMIFPSLFEGFGIPVVEAMASGCPVACARATSLPEVVGNDGLLFDPENVEAIAGAISRLATDEPFRKGLAEKLRPRAHRFTGQAMAKATADVYRKVTAEP